MKTGLGISPFIFKQLRKAEGAFRCDECGYIYPKSFRVEQDGLIICKVNCWRTMGRDDIDLANAEAVVEATEGAENQYEEEPVYSGLVGQVLIYRFDPLVIELGTTDTTDVTVEGINLHDDITYTTNATGVVIAVISTAVDEESQVIRFTSTAAAAGDYHVSCSLRDQGPIRKNILVIR